MTKVTFFHYEGFNLSSTRGFKTATHFGWRCLHLFFQNMAERPACVKLFQGLQKCQGDGVCARNVYCSELPIASVFGEVYGGLTQNSTFLVSRLVIFAEYKSKLAAQIRQRQGQ